jgi:hypothetical protein
MPVGRLVVTVAAIAATVLTLGAILVAGASHGESAPRTEPVTTTASKAAAPNAVSATPGGTRIPSAVVTIELGEWPVQSFDGVFAVGERYVVRPDPKELRSVVIERRGGGVVLQHRILEPGFETDFAGIHGNKVVVVDEDVASSEAAKADARATIYDLESGRATALSEVRGAPPLSKYGPQATISEDGKYYYSASRGVTPSQCVGEVDLIKMRGRLVECAEREGIILYIGSGEHGASWTHFKTGDFQSCRVGRGIRGKERFTMAEMDCDTFDTAALGGWHLRSLHPPGAVLAPALPLVAERGRNRVDLGLARGQSLIACNGHAFWKQEVTAPVPAQRIVRWRPDGPVELVHETHEPPSSSTEAVLLTPRSCNEGLLTVTVVRTSGGPFWARLLIVR